MFFRGSSRILPRVFVILEINRADSQRLFKGSKSCFKDLCRSSVLQEFIRYFSKTTIKEYFMISFISISYIIWRFFHQYVKTNSNISSWISYKIPRRNWYNLKKNKNSPIPVEVFFPPISPLFPGDLPLSQVFSLLIFPWFLHKFHLDFPQQKATALIPIVLQMFRYSSTKSYMMLSRASFI